MTYEKSCGAIIFTRANDEIKFVLVQQMEGFYGFPKGHAEFGETEKETALREIFEEVHLTPTIIDGFVTIDEHAIPNKKDVIKKVVYFLAEYENQKIIFQKDELLSASLVSYDEAMNMLTYESSKRILTEAINFLANR